MGVRIGEDCREEAKIPLVEKKTGFESDSPGNYRRVVEYNISFSRNANGFGIPISLVINQVTGKTISGARPLPKIEFFLKSR